VRGWPLAACDAFDAELAHQPRGALLPDPDALLDAFSRRVVGWSISHNPTAALTCNALEMAIEQREANRGTVGRA
jgi:transposase InsO family protein